MIYNLVDLKRAFLQGYVAGAYRQETFDKTASAVLVEAKDVWAELLERYHLETDKHAGG